MIFRQTQKFRLETIMSFENFSLMFEDKSLRRMKASEIGGSPSGFIQSSIQHYIGVYQKFLRLF
jgi:hypothetical protein